MRAVRINEFGDPAQVVEVVDLPEPGKPEPGEVLVRVEYAPVNFADLLVVSGDFFHKPQLPATLGNEGVATVIELGADVKHLEVGDLVNPAMYSGTWVERMIVPAAGLVALPDVDLQQASMIRVNPPTADLMLSEIVDLKPGDWVVQNAANSGVGRAVMAFAKERGVRTINLVRRPELIEELEDIGGDLVLLDESSSIPRASDVVRSGRVALALDGVSGPATARLAEFLSPGGVLVSYAMMSGEMTAPADLRPLLSKGIGLQFFYLGDERFKNKMENSVRRGAELISEGKLHAPVASVYPLEDARLAIEHVLKGGKVLLDVRAA